MVVEHGLGEVRAIQSADGMRYAGAVGVCLCKQEFSAASKDDAWKALAGHVAPHLLSELEVRDGDR